jgi:Sel1 repeat-containing protein
MCSGGSLSARVGRSPGRSLGAIWLAKAANKNDRTAQAELGVLYLAGQGVPHDDAMAATWLAKAAEQGSQLAQAKLASLYEHGRGVPLDLNRAYIWRLLSLGDSNSQPTHELQDLAALMSPEDVTAAPREASQWRQAHLAMPSSEDDSELIAKPDGCHCQLLIPAKRTTSSPSRGVPLTSSHAAERRPASSRGWVDLQRRR